MFLAKKYKLILLLLLIFLGSFIILSPVQAIIGTGIFDYTSAVLDALDFCDRVLNLLVKLVILAYISSGFVVLAAHLLEWSMALPVYLSNPIVLGGFNFVLGLVNLFFVLSLVFIALAHILKIESFELKKALPKLIIVILLVNFSMLIVGTLVDVAQFFMNTFLNTFGGDFVSIALMPLRASMGSLISLTITTITVYVVSAFTVFGSIFALSSLVLVQLFGGNLLGQIFSTVFLVVMNLLLGSIFFIYFILFIVRIAVLWLLAIFAPIAFFCIIFKQTSQYAEKWFKAVLGWAFLGVVVFFLLSLFTSLFTGAFFQQPGAISIPPAPGVPSFSLPNSVYNYLFLMIFLGVSWYISVKYVPVGADRITKLAKGQMMGLVGVAGKATGLVKKGRDRWRQTKHMKKGEEKLVGMMGKLPGIGPGITVKHRERQRREIAEEKKKMELLSVEERQQKVIDSKIASPARKQAALELNAKEGRLRNEDKEKGIKGDKAQVETLVALGADPSPFVKARKDWAGDLKAISERKEFEKLNPEKKEKFKRDAIQEAVQKEGNEEFRKNTQAEALENLDVIWAMSRKQVERIEERGSEAQRAKARNLVASKEGRNDLRKRTASLQNSIQPGMSRGEVNRIRGKIKEQAWKVGTIANKF